MNETTDTDIDGVNPAADANAEDHLFVLAQVESDALADLERAVKEHDVDIRRIEARFVERVGPLVEAEAKARVELHNAIVDSPASLWSKRRTRTLGLCKYGWRKRRGRLVVGDEQFAIKRLREILGESDAAGYLRVKVALVRQRINTLSADILRKCGIQVESDGDEVVVESTMGELAKRVERLRDASVEDLRLDG